MAILQISDFTNNPLFKISLTRKAENELDTLIQDVEKRYLTDLFGVDLYALFVADLTTSTPQTPQSPKYKTLFDEIRNSNVMGCTINSEGMRYMLMGFVYFEWHSYNYVQSTPSGQTQSAVENSNVLSPEASGIYEKYNRSVDSYKAIQHYIELNLSDYPEYMGKYIEYNTFI